MSFWNFTTEEIPAKKRSKLEQYQYEAQKAQGESRKANSFWGLTKNTFFGIPEATKNIINSTPKKRMEFKVGEGLNPEQRKTAEQTVRKQGFWSPEALGFGESLDVFKSKIASQTQKNFNPTYTPSPELVKESINTAFINPVLGASSPLSEITSGSSPISREFINYLKNAKNPEEIALRFRNYKIPPEILKPLSENLAGARTSEEVIDILKKVDTTLKLPGKVDTGPINVESKIVDETAPEIAKVPKNLEQAKIDYITKLKKISPNQPESWYKGQLERQPFVQTPEKFGFNPLQKTGVELPRVPQPTEISGKVSTKPEILPLSKPTTPSRLQDLSYKASVPEIPLKVNTPTSKELEPLAQEAKKYESAEEFVKAQGEPIYHGSKNLKNIQDGGLDTSKNLFVTRDKNYASTFGDVGEFVLPKTAKVKTLDNLNITKDLLAKKDGISNINDLFNSYKKQGFDAIEVVNKSKNHSEITVLNPEILKTKSQLTDFYNKAVGKIIERRAPPARIVDYKNIQDPTIKNLVASGKETRLDKIFRKKSGILNSRYYRYQNLQDHPQLLVKLSGLKEINARGHSLGDKAIREVEDALYEVSPKAKLVHKGSKNFSVITEGMPETEVIKINRALEKLNGEHPEYGLSSRWGTNFKKADIQFPKNERGATAFSTDFKIENYSSKGVPIRSANIKLESKHSISDFKTLSTPHTREIFNDKIPDSEQLKELRINYTDEPSGVFNKDAFNESGSASKPQLVLDGDGISVYQKKMIAKYGEEIGIQKTDEFVSTMLKLMEKEFKAKVFRLGDMSDETAITISNTPDLAKKLERIRVELQKQFGKDVNFTSAWGKNFKEADALLTKMKDNLGKKGVDFLNGKEYTSLYEKPITKSEGISTPRIGISGRTEVRQNRQIGKGGSIAKGNLQEDGGIGRSRVRLLQKRELTPGEKYVAEQVTSRESARKAETLGIKGKTKSFLANVKAKLVDFTAPIEDVLNATTKKNKISLLPEDDIHNQIDRVLRSPTLAGQFAKDNGLVKLIREVDNLDNLDQYLIARHAIELDKRGIKTGRDLIKDQALIKEFASKYEKYSKIISNYSQKLLDYSVESGLINKGLADILKVRYPNYVPFQRVFSELEKTQGIGTSGVASLSKQNIIQKIEGSEREIESPIESLLTKTNDAFKQGEKNLAGKMLAGYEHLPGNPFQLKEIKNGEIGGKSTISFFDNGEKRIFETTPEVANAAKALNVQQLNILGKIFALPTRIARVGITGINLPFIGANIAKDQVTAFINSNHGLKTSLANPANFLRSLFSAVGHDKLYQEMVRSGGAGTSFDISRNQVAQTVKGIRASKNVGTKILYTVRHPSELLKAVENIIGRGEELTRIQQYRGTKEALLEKGMSEKSAMTAAARQAREATVNFARRGEWGTVLNSAFLYLNASIQGTRTLLRNLKTKPLQTGIKIIIAALLPVATATAWNLSDPKRKEAYDDIPEYEKQNNIIIIPPNPTKDEKGKWNVIKIPLSQEINNLVSLARRPIEAAYGLDPLKFGDFAQALIGTVSPIAPTKGSILSTLTPQALKPTIEAATNRSLFTGYPQVPASLEKLSPENQIKKTTSQFAIFMGKKLGVSPIKIDEFVKGTFGGVGSQITGQQNVIEAVYARFGKAQGGASENKEVSDIQKSLQRQADTRSELKQQAEKLDVELQKLSPEEARARFNQINTENPLLADKLKDVVEERKLGLTYKEKLMKQLGVENGERAKYIDEQIMKLATSEERRAYYDELVRKKIISDNVAKQLRDLKAK